MSRSGDQSSILTSHDPILKRALFAEMLQDLTFNSKDVINKITLFAGKNKDVADIVHELLTGKLREVRIRFLFEFGLYSNKNKLLKTTLFFDVFLTRNVSIFSRFSFFFFTFSIFLLFCSFFLDNRFFSLPIDRGRLSCTPP